jgi:hypothetical protein
MAITFRGGVRSPLILGNDTVTHNLFVAENGIASRVNVLIRELSVDVDTIGALTAVMPIIRAVRCTAVTGGNILAKQKLDTALTSDAAVQFRSPDYEASDIALTPTQTLWQSMRPRAHTIVEQIVSHEGPYGFNTLPDLTKDIVLRPGQAIALQLTGTAGGSNAALTYTYKTACVWEEDAIATFAISGTVTLSGSPVAGAIVTVIEADDVNMTNAVLRETIVTPAGGTWASSIRTGKVGAAFVQYETGGTKYTAPGSPYLA